MPFLHRSGACSEQLLISLSTVANAILVTYPEHFIFFLLFLLFPTFMSPPNNTEIQTNKT